MLKDLIAFLSLKKNTRYWALLNWGMKLKNQKNETLTLCDWSASA
jgi:hypothetical protein